jgi:putative transposase
MTEEQKKRVATFRFGIIGDLVTSSNLEYGEQERLLQEKCARQWDIPYSSRTSISRGTIFDWINKYKNSGHKLESLYPKKRSDAGKSRSIIDETAASIIQIKKEKPSITLEALINETVNDTPGLIASNLPPSNVYRLLKSQDMTGKNVRTPKDRRKFEAENPNDLWQSDVMHGPKLIHNKKNRKSYLIAIIDDHSRIIPNACFYFSENLATYLKFLEGAFLTRGLPRKLYVDNGSAFKSHHLKYVTASLEIALINAKPYQPQGKGYGKLNIMESWYL